MTSNPCNDIDLVILMLLRLVFKIFCFPTIKYSRPCLTGGYSRSSSTRSDFHQTQQSPGSQWGSRPCSGSRNRAPSRRSGPSRLCRRSGRTTGSSPSCCSDRPDPSRSGSSGESGEQRSIFGYHPLFLPTERTSKIGLTMVCWSHNNGYSPLLWIG